MAINNKDDYEKLAKILYPSIEASGNVYYGQTRKLTMDEILGKNELNFESHIETFNNGDFTYKSYFNWKIGPLHGSVLIGITDFLTDNYATDYLTFPGNEYIFLGEGEHETGPNYTQSTFFAKYNLNIKQITEDNNIMSSNFNTYSYNVVAEFNSICYTNGTSPINFNDYDLTNRSFYVDPAGPFIYIRILGFEYNVPEILYSAEELSTPLTFYSEMGDIFHFAAHLTDVDDECSLYKYRINGGDWQSMNISRVDDLTPGQCIKYYNDINIPQNGRVEIICSNYVPLHSYSKYMFIEGFANTVLASGNINSLINENFAEIDTVGDCEFFSFFSNCAMLSTAPILPATNLGMGCYASMFANTALTIPPELPATTLNKDCYAYMFKGCDSLTKTPILRAKVLPNYCYESMFDSCISLDTIYCYAKEFGNGSTDDWIIDSDYNSRDGNLYLDPSANWNFDDDDDSVPGNWVRKNNMSFIFKSCESNIKDGLKDFNLSVSGSDSPSNGRGLLNEETLFNMLDTNPVYNDGVIFDTYNKDGSFNQEIWGYKCFNSPVMFRNGIYGECASLTTYELSNDNISPAIVNKLNSSSLKTNSLQNIQNDLNSLLTISTYEQSNNDSTIYGSQSTLCTIWSENSTNIGYISEDNSSIPNNCAGLFNYVSGSDNISFSSILAVKASDSSAYIKLYDSSYRNRSSITATANVITINSLENINLNTGASVVIPLDDSLIDEDDFTADTQSLVIGNTRADNSGALIINTSYGYDMRLPIYETIPISSTVKLECNLNDNGGNHISESSISYKNYSNGDSVIEISCSTCSLPTSDLYGDFTVAGDGGNMFKVTSDELMPSVDVYCDLTIDSGNLTVSSGNVFISGNLTVNGTIIATDQATDLNVSGDLHVTGDATIDGQLSVGGIGTIKLGGNNDDALEIDSSRGYDIIFNAGSNAVDIQSARIYLSALDSYVTGNLSITGSTVVINGASLTGNNNYFAMDKSLNVSGQFAATGQVIVGEHAVVGLYNHPYYIKSYQGELHIGDSLNANNDAIGGALKVDSIKTSTISAITTTSGIVANSLQFSGNSGPLNLNNAYPVIHQSSSSESEIPLGAIIFARVLSNEPVFAGNVIPPGSIIQLVDLCKHNETFWTPTPGGHSSNSYDILKVYDNNLAISTNQPRILYATFTPITRRYDSGDGTGLKYQNLAIIMRVQ